MDQDEQRDYAEEAYNRNLCPGCDRSPCPENGHCEDEEAVELAADSLAAARAEHDREEELAAADAEEGEAAEEAVRAWLLDYAWSGDAAKRAAEVDCIMAQGEWKHLGAMTEKYAGQAAEPGPAAVSEAAGFALSSLYECHDGPHQPGCPAG